MLARRLLVLGPLLLLILILSPAIGKLTINNASWLPAQHPARLAKQYLAEEFQHGEELLISIRPQRDYFSQELLDELHGVYEKLKQHPSVRSVLSPLHSRRVFKDTKGELDVIHYRAALEKGLLKDITQYRQHLISSEDWGQNIARDATAFALVVTIDPEGLRARQDRQEVIQLATGLLDQSAYLSDYDLSGEVALFHQLDSQSRNALVWLLPSIALLMFLVLVLTCRSFFRGLALFCVAVLISLLAANLLVFNGYAINLVSIGPLVLLPGAALVNAVHILTRWRYLAHVRSIKARLRRTLRETWSPCLATSLAAGVGLGTLYPNVLLPLSQLGLIACISIIVAYPIVLAAIFAILFVWNVGGKATQEGSAMQDPSEQEQTLSVRQLRPPWICQATEWLQRYALPIVLCVLLGSGYFVFQLKNLQMETHFLDLLLPQTSRMHRAEEFADRHLGGSGAISIILPKEDQAFTAINVLNRVIALTEDLARARPIRHVSTYLQPIALAHAAEQGAANYPDTQEQLTQHLRALRSTDVNDKDDLLTPYVDARYAVGRLQLRVPNLDFTQMESLTQETLQPTLAKYGEKRFLITGPSAYFHTLNHYVGRAQLISFLPCFILIWCLFVVLFGLGLGSVAMLSNLLPIGMALGSMALLGLPFDLAAVLVSCLGLGLCAGNSAHYLHCYNLYQRAAHKDAPPKYARPSLVLPQVSNALARPIFFTSLLLLICLCLLSGTNLIVMMRFGLFGALTIGASFFSTFVFLPCLLTLMDKMDPLWQRLRFNLAFKSRH